MTDEEDRDDMDGFDPEASPEDAGDPAVAFEALRRTIETQGAQIGAEMTIIRRGLEAAFDQLDKIEPPVDYKPQLAQLVQQLAQVGDRVHGVEKSPVLRHGVEHYAGMLERSGENLVRGATHQLEIQATALEYTASNLARHVAGARERRKQDHWLWGVGAAGLVAGILLTLFIPRVLPGSVDMAVAATVMNADRWNAGGALMQSASPQSWQSIVDASNLVGDNRDVLAACAKAATEAKKDQRCTITVAAPMR